MGLDNGIELKRTNIKQDDLPEYADIGMYIDEKGEPCYEVCYWRKCWNIRHMIYKVIGGNPNDIYQNEYELSEQNVNDILDGLIGFLKDPTNWSNEDRGSIWSFDEILPHLAKNIANLAWLANKLKDPGFKGTVTFYDSY